MGGGVAGGLLTPASRTAWIGILAGLAAQASAYAIAIVADPEAATATWLSIVGISATLTGTLILGALRSGRLSRAATFAASMQFVVLVVCFGIAALLPAENAGTSLWLGLPRRASMVLIGVGVLPMLFLPAAYAWDSRGAPLDGAELERLRRECARLRGGMES